MSSENQKLLTALFRQDFQSFLRKCFATVAPGKTFLDSWHLGSMAHELSEVTAGRTTRLIINVPPRSLKSISVSVAYVAFRMGHDPGLKVIVVSHAAELARQHARDFRQIVESDWYRAVFPDFKVAAVGDRLYETLTTKNGYRLATSVGASVTGKGADLIIVDDPNKAQDVQSEARRREVNGYFDLTLYTRLDNKQTGAIIVVMQRLHADDLVGHIEETELWTKLAIPAIEVEDCDYRTGPSPRDIYRRAAGEILQPERDSQEVLDRSRAVMGSMAFEAQYQQNPIPAEGNIIKRSWIRHYNVAPSEFELIIVSWDTATTIGEGADYSVGTVWGLYHSQFFLLDVVRGRIEAPDLRRLVEGTELKWQAHVSIIEKTGIGHALLQDIRRTMSIRPILIAPKYDKLSRLVAQSPKFEAGQVFLPHEAPWLGTYISELLAFPFGRHDDQVDSSSQALKYLTTKLPPPVRAPRPYKSGSERPAGNIGRKRQPPRP